MSRSDTVLSAWFEVVAEALSLPCDDELPTTKRILARFGVSWRPDRHSSELTPSGGGGNVRADAFQDLLEAMISDPRVELLAASAQGVSHGDGEGLDAGQDNYLLRAIRVRRGQPDFRLSLLRAYEARCATTRCDTVEVLEAAHKVPYHQGGDYSVTNGLLLRSDVHTLFHLGHLGFDATTGAILLPPQSRGSSLGNELEGKMLRLPKTSEHRPRLRDLAERNIWLGLDAKWGEQADNGH